MKLLSILLTTTTLFSLNEAVALTKQQKSNSIAAMCLLSNAFVNAQSQSSPPPQQQSQSSSSSQLTATTTTSSTSDSPMYTSQMQWFKPTSVNACMLQDPPQEGGIALNVDIFDPSLCGQQYTVQTEVNGSLVAVTGTVIEACCDPSLVLVTPDLFTNFSDLDTGYLNGAVYQQII